MGDGMLIYFAISRQRDDASACARRSAVEAVPR
jgi:hypothetical protein